MFKNLLKIFTITLLFTQLNAANMVTNGDFEDGVSGFTSDYRDVTGTVSYPGSGGYGYPRTMIQGDYAVDTDADTYDEPYFLSLGDHTTGSGKYFISDAGTDTSKTVWQSGRTIVIDSTSKVYRFEAYIADVNDDPYATDLPILSFEIGDGTNWVSMGTSVDLTGQNGVWVQTYTDIKFSGTGTFYIRLKNAQSNGIGNDLGLDDISFDEAPNGATSSQTVNLGTLDAAPVTTTQAVSSITQTTAIGNGNITSLGTVNPTAYGVCWSTSANPTTSDTCTDEGSTSSTGAFTTAITGLTIGTTYNVRAYATNSVGTSYGSNVTFNTSSLLPDPTQKADVVGNVKAWTNISNNWASKSINNIEDRFDYLRRNKDRIVASAQGIDIKFKDDILNKLAKQTIALDDGTEYRNWSTWIDGEIMIGDVDATTNSSALDVKASMISFGLDRPYNEHRVGFALAFGEDKVDVGTLGSKVDSKNYSITSYGVFAIPSNLSLEVLLGLGHIDFDTTRIDGSETLQGSRDADQVFTSLAIKKADEIVYNGYNITPYLKLNATETRLNSFAESGGTLALTFLDQTVQTATVFVGLDTHTNTELNGVNLKPFAKLEYGADVSGSSDAKMHYNSETTQYTLTLDKEATSHWKGTLGTDILFSKDLNSRVLYSKEVAVNASDSDSVKFELTYQF